VIGRLSPWLNRTSAQKMDGTRVEQYEALKPLGSVRRREVVWPDGNPVTIYVEMGLKTTTPVVRGALFNWASRFSPESDCSSRNETFVVDHQKNAVHKVMGHETLGGVDAVKLSTPSGDILWLAPSVDCVPLGMYASSDGPAARSIRLDLVSVTTGPPDPALFAIDSFKEVAPSELNIAAERYGANLVPSFTPAGIEEMVQKMRADKQWEALDAAWRARWVH